jgi:hypothetical protein
LSLLACSSLTPAPEAPDAQQADEPVSIDPVLRAMAARPLVETRHGECRMACRHIDREEVEGVLTGGQIDPSRTRDDGPCRSYAVHGTTRDGQNARVVLAACADETKVITVIDLDRDWPCDCP